MSKYQGGCACGAVRFSTDADPVMAGHCQCRHCQQLSGGGHSSFAAFPAADMKVEGALKEWTYTADSGNTASRSHCPVCGSPVVAKTSGMKEMIAVSLGALDDPSMVAPGMVFFNGKALAWDHLEAGLPRFPGMPPM